LKRDEAWKEAGGAGSSTDRSREYEQWAKFEGPRAPGGGPGSQEEEKK